MTQPFQGTQSNSVQATIEQLRYWAPSIKDVASVDEYAADGHWSLVIRPHVATACPVAITIKDSGRLDLALGGETYLDRTFEAHDRIITLLEKVVEGAVIQRQWTSAVTGTPQSIETIIMLGPDLVWRDGAEPGGASEHRDRHFLPYRRV
jgi:hypothetical protein